MKRNAVMQKVHPGAYATTPKTEGANSTALDSPAVSRGELPTATQISNQPDNPLPAASAKAQHVKPKKRKPMLTSAQLSDLFTRLDKNGDGVLDLDEFIGLIRLLKIDVSEDYAASVFHQVDQAAGNSELTGTLDMQEFIAAYQKIYCGTKVDAATGRSAQNNSFIRATRYGRMLNGEYVFECYTLPSVGACEKYTLDLTAHSKDSSDSDTDSDEEERVKEEQAPMNFWDAVAEPYDGTIEDIIKLIRQDSSRNKTLHSNVLWWIDASYESVNRSTAEDIVTTFGLPNDSKFLSNFGNFGNSMPGDEKSRMFAGTGNHTSGLMCSLSCFAQTMWLKSVPVVHHLPPWLQLWKDNYSEKAGFWSKALQAAMDYYKTRFAWLINISWINTRDDEEKQAYLRAEGLASIIKNSDDFEEPGVTFSPRQTMEVLDPNGTIFSSQGQGVPLKITRAYTDIPTWLSSSNYLRKHPAQVVQDTMSFHLLDQGFGTHTLLTVRQLDGERQKHFTLEQQSRAGVLGRIVAGVWVKLAQVTSKGNKAGAAGELTDSPASLVTFLLMLMHNFSMNSCSVVDNWLRVLEKDIRDVVVSKHSTHVSDVERILKDFTSYIDPIEGILQSLAAEHSALQRVDESNTLVTVVPELPVVPARTTKKTLLKRATLLQFDTTAHPALPEGAEKLALGFALIHRFLGPSPYREIRALLDGYELLDIRGLTFWKERIARFVTKVDELQLLIKLQVDEKRNLTGFMLTAITTILAPLTIFTGYFGMNFDNMDELKATTHPHFPGVVIMWAFCGATYLILLLLGVHFRVLYSVS